MFTGASSESAEDKSSAQLFIALKDHNHGGALRNFINERGREVVDSDDSSDDSDSSSEGSNDSFVSSVREDSAAVHRNMKPVNIYVSSTCCSDVRSGIEGGLRALRVHGVDFDLDMENIVCESIVVYVSFDYLYPQNVLLDCTKCLLIIMKQFAYGVSAS